MRAFLVLGRAAVSYYNDLFLLVGLSVLWWLTGGIFVGAAGFFAVPAIVGGVVYPWWLAPLIAIPAGPSMAAMAVVARRCARDIHVDRSYYTGAWRTYWRPALALSAIGSVVLALLLLNLVFYYAQPNPYLQLASILWIYLIVVWLAIQIYAYAVLVALEQPRALVALRTAAVSAFANPLFSALLVLIAVLLTAFCTVFAAPLLLAWPALMALIGEHGFRLILARAGIDPDQGEA